MRHYIPQRRVFTALALRIAKLVLLDHVMDVFLLFCSIHRSNRLYSICTWNVSGRLLPLLRHGFLDACALAVGDHSIEAVFGIVSRLVEVASSWAAMNSGDARCWIPTSERRVPQV